jgi:hypothetical protein
MIIWLCCANRYLEMSSGKQMSQVISVLPVPGDAIFCRSPESVRKKRGQDP